MAKTYAWSKFNTEVNEWGQALKTIVPGDEITQKDLGVSDAEWEYLLEVGAVSEQPYPDIPNDVAPAEHWAAQNSQFASGTLTADEAKEVQARQAAEADEEVAAANAAAGEVTSTSTKK